MFWVLFLVLVLGWVWLTIRSARQPIGAEPAVPCCREAARRSEVPTTLTPPPVDAESDDEVMEAVLAASLLTGRRPREHYRQAMALLAARDAVIHPLTAPPEADR